MIRELKLQSHSSNSKKGNKLYDSSSKVSNDYTSVNTKYSNNEKKEYIESSPMTIESTFYNTLRGKHTDREKEDVVLENLKYFVNHAESVRKVEEVIDTPRVVFTSKDYLKEKNALLNSIYHANNFKNTKTKNRRTNSSINFFNFEQENCLEDNVKKMEDIVIELKSSVFDRLNRVMADKTKLKDEIESSNDVLTNRLRISQERLNSYKKFNYNTSNDTTKFEYLNERIVRENSHMEMEIPMVQKRVSDMKNEIFEKDRESKQLKYQTYRYESEVIYLQEENRRVGKQVIDLQNEKKSMMTAIVMLKKQSDILKEKVIREHGKSKDFIAEVNTLLHRGKVLY